MFWPVHWIRTAKYGVRYRLRTEYEDIQKREYIVGVKDEF
ncbi:hypothetical protein TFUB20_02518 [Tannerella forsythia]|uniref:Uncharacterized protein n=1 Tax=Tannerella forsythia TaxID=28112 RepID=A0A1D3UW92_TANFO|nr:hypothetical protein TFUB20_02518 [Tannerella forsythia]